MTAQRARGPVVIDTNVFGADLVPGSPLTDRSGMDLVLAWAQLRADRERIGHALGQREHDGDRWIAATALRLGVPLVSDDGIFRGAPGLILVTALDG